MGTIIESYGINSEYIIHLRIDLPVCPGLGCLHAHTLVLLIPKLCSSWSCPKLKHPSQLKPLIKTTTWKGEKTKTTR